MCGATAWQRRSDRLKLWICRFAWTTQTRCPHTHSSDRRKRRKRLEDSFEEEENRNGRCLYTLISTVPGPSDGVHLTYGVYDITQNKGWVSVGISFDTARFAVNTLRQWWLNCGEREYAGTQGLLVNTDGGGSNGSRVRLWKISLQEFADEINIPITVCHYPPGTSNWNSIEHRMFAPISANWRAKPLRSFNDATQYIRATTTKTGLTIDAALDTTICEKLSKKRLRTEDLPPLPRQSRRLRRKSRSF